MNQDIANSIMLEQGLSNLYTTVDQVCFTTRKLACAHAKSIGSIFIKVWKYVPEPVKYTLETMQDEDVNDFFFGEHLRQIAYV